MNLGLRRGTVRLEPHDDAWAAAAGETIAQLEKILGEDAVDIQHVGSTAIRGIPAKPILDIAVAVEDFDGLSRHLDALEQAGFLYRGEDHPGERLLVLGTQDSRSHHIHVVLGDSPAWRDYILFRDYLNAHPQDAARYGRVKEELAEAYPNDRGAYTAGKEAVIREIFARARAEDWR